MRRQISSYFTLVSLALMTACAAPPDNLDTTLTRATLEKKYVVTLQPPTKQAAINEIHSWQFKLTTAAGLPVEHARIAVDGGMPQHGHGLPTRPQVSQESVNGNYLIEGMKFSMTGWWEIKLAIQSDAGSDKVTFNTVVESPSIHR
jgi:hypothetical protein